MKKKYYTYIILTKKNTFYCGYTDDVEKRFWAHVKGKGAKYTRAYKPEKVVYVKEFETKEQAQTHERILKKLNKQQKTTTIENTVLLEKYKSLQNFT